MKIAEGTPSAVSPENTNLKAVFDALSNYPRPI